MTRRPLIAAIAVAMALVAPACAKRTTPPTRSRPSSRRAAVTDRDFDGTRFHRSTGITNRWLPLMPGTQLVYRGYASEEGDRFERREVFTVTDLTKVIHGIRAAVIYDVDYTDGEVAEVELAFFAQDDDGTVWNLGEYPEEWEDGAYVEASDTWIDGIQGARPGILMLADPKVGAPTYLQGFAPAIEFADNAVVRRMDQHSCVPVGCYDNVLLIDESDPVEPAAIQVKYYASGVGNIRVSFAGSDQEKEELVLAKVLHLDATALAAVRDDVLAVDRRAYERSPQVYARTSRMESAAAA